MIFLDFGGSLFFLLFVFLGEAFSTFAHFVEGADHDENYKANDEEVDDGLEEVAIVNGGRFDTLNIGRDGEFEGAEVETTDNHRDKWHDDVINERGNNGGESATDDNADSEIHD